MSYWANSPQMWGFPDEDQSRSCKCMRWCRGCLGKACSDNREM
jgi:hypothetical protein